jgi:hypothetical protein
MNGVLVRGLAAAFDYEGMLSRFRATRKTREQAPSKKSGGKPHAVQNEACPPLMGIPALRKQANHGLDGSLPLVIPCQSLPRAKAGAGIQGACKIPSSKQDGKHGAVVRAPP